MTSSISFLNGYFRRDVGADCATWRRNTEIHRRRPAHAIFPLSQPSACANLLHAVAEARQAMIALNGKNGETGRAPLNYGIGVPRRRRRHVRQYRVAHPALRLHRHRSCGQHGLASRSPHQTVGQNRAAVPRVRRLRRKRFRSRTRRRISSPPDSTTQSKRRSRITAECRSIIRVRSRSFAVCKTVYTSSILFVTSINKIQLLPYNS